MNVDRDGGYAPESGLRRLNWGCGSHLGAGWINSDAKEEPGVDLVADIRQGLPLEADSVDCVVSVHALPELSYRRQVPVLQELLRVLRPGGAIRLVLPDLDLAIDAYRRGDASYFKVPPEEAKSPGGRFIAHLLWFGYTRTLFTADFAAELLAEAGFEGVERCSYRRTASPFGSIVELDNREDESMYVEARKPRIGSRPQVLPYNARVPADGLEIVDVAPDPGQGLRGHFRVRNGEDSKVEIIGWVLGHEAQATEVEVLVDGAVAGRAPIAVDRPDVAERFPDLAAAATCGFRIELMAKGKGESQLEIYAVMDDEGREPLGRVLVKTNRRGLFGAFRRN
jgi:Methyltransferase domain